MGLQVDASVSERGRLGELLSCGGPGGGREAGGGGRGRGGRWGGGRGSLATGAAKQVGEGGAIPWAIKKSTGHMSNAANLPTKKKDVAAHPKDIQPTWVLMKAWTRV